jgi:hypothetical protein
LRFRQIVIAYDILRDARRRAAQKGLPLSGPQRFRSKSTRIVMSGAIAIGLLTVSLLGGYGYGLFVSAPATDVMTVKKDDDIPTAVGAARVDTDSAGGLTDLTAAQPAMPTNMTGQDRPHDKHDGVEFADGAGKLSAPAATSSVDGEVIADRKAAIDLPRNDANFYRERGVASHRSGDFRRAIASLGEAIRLDPSDAQTYDLRGNTWDEMGIFERAVADYDEAIRIDPNNPALFHDRGIMWQHKGELDKALVDLDRAIRFSFADVNVYCERGLVWYEKGHRDRAIADFTRAIKLDPNLASTCISSGLIVHRSGEFEVVLYGDKAIRVDPTIVDALLHTN